LAKAADTLPNEAGSTAPPHSAAWLGSLKRIINLSFVTQLSFWRKSTQDAASDSFGAFQTSPSGCVARRIIGMSFSLRSLSKN